MSTMPAAPAAIGRESLLDAMHRLGIDTKNLETVEFGLSNVRLTYLVRDVLPGHISFPRVTFDVAITDEEK